MSSNQVAPVDKVPTELLEIIFNVVYEDFKTSPPNEGFERGLNRPEVDISEIESDDDDDGHEAELEIAEFLQHQSSVLFSSSLETIFPYTLANVCREWEEVLSFSPKFWTRLVLMIGAPSTPIARARKYLAWSRQLPINVLILRSHGPLEYEKQVEREVVHSFLELLQPHMKRCRSLHLDIKISSSLPSPLKIVPNHALSLRALYIHCGIDDPDLGNADKEAEVDVDSMNRDLVPYDGELPRLYTMKIDGRTFLRTLHNPLPLFTIQPQLRHLEIATFNAPGSTLPLFKSLTTIGSNFRFSLRSLCFSGLNFNVDTEYESGNHNYEFERVRSLVIDAVRPVEAVEELFQRFSFPNLDILNIQDCSGLSPAVFDLIDSIVPILSVQNFDKSKERNVAPGSSTPHSDIIHFLSGWSGLELSLSRSNTPFDDVLDALSSTTPSPSTFNTFLPPKDVLCPNLQSILIAASPSPSFASVKKLIERRNKTVNYKDPRWRERDYDGPVITKIEMKFCFPEWTRAEMQWVRKRVVDFGWSKF